LRAKLLKPRRAARPVPYFFDAGAAWLRVDAAIAFTPPATKHIPTTMRQARRRFIGVQEWVFVVAPDLLRHFTVKRGGCGTRIGVRIDGDSHPWEHTQPGCRGTPLRPEAAISCHLHYQAAATLRGRRS